VLRHPQYFYLSESGNHVLAGAGLCHGKLVEKIPLMLMKEKIGPLLQTLKSAAPKP
jgi:hypothetical protein